MTNHFSVFQIRTDCKDLIDENELFQQSSGLWPTARISARSHDVTCIVKTSLLRIFVLDSYIHHQHRTSSLSICFTNWQCYKWITDSNILWSWWISWLRIPLEFHRSKTIRLSNMSIEVSRFWAERSMSTIKECNKSFLISVNLLHLSFAKWKKKWINVFRRSIDDLKKWKKNLSRHRFQMKRSKSFRIALKISLVIASCYENTQEDFRYEVTTFWMTNAKEH